MSLPTLEEAQAIVNLHQRVAQADQAELARIGAELLTDQDDNADDITRQIISDAIYAEATLRGAA